MITEHFQRKKPLWAWGTNVGVKSLNSVMKLLLLVIFVEKAILNSMHNIFITLLSQAGKVAKTKTSH